MTTRPRVYTRIRPLNAREVDAGGEMCLFTEKGHSDVLCFDKDSDQMKTRFDYVFDQDKTQDDVFAHIGTEVMSTLFSGYNASIFAYGQTGSGKTWTMEGNKESPSGRGLIPRLIEAILNRLATGADISNHSVQMSFVQIYQEKIQDLLNARKQLDIHMDRTGQYIAQGATWRDIGDAASALELYTESVRMRATSATEMNLVSSRSHTILMIKMQWDEPHLPGSKAQLNLIDLAGSEKLYQSGATGETMKEAIHINKSLSALGNVVSKLVDAVQAHKKGVKIHIPYKDSKLTYLLQSSLGGGNLVHFILALSASSQWKAESSSTIEFGKRALKLVIKPVRNPIDYKRLAEMEAMIEKMRNHIRTLEDELAENKSSGQNAGFLRINQLHQEGDDARARRAKRTATKATLKSKTELNRIMANLPETLEDLTSHCVLHPNAKTDFRHLGGIERLVHFIDKSPSTFHRAHAAHTLAHVMDDDGRDEFGEKGGMEALGRLLHVREERCKEAACVAYEVVVRNHDNNKRRITDDVYKALTDLIFGYPNQQVQEAACTALASIVDSFPSAKSALAPLQIVKKLLDTIKDAPVEVVHVTKAAATCLGRLAHGDTSMQKEIADLGGVDILIDDVLFSPAGDRDHQVPIMASYALVNLCCSNAANMGIAKRHPNYDEVRYRLMEGLARAFGTNTMREGFGRASAEETTSPFPYYGVTVMGEWTMFSSGGRPIFSTFMENPQFYLYVSQDTQLSLLIQDVLYESRMQQKQRNNTVYMGIAIFQGDGDLSRSGLKQLDFHGKMAEIAKFTSNCENVLHCTLKKADAPYIVVPFTSQRGRTSKFALSAFADKPVELTQVPDTAGWVRHVVEGAWTELTGRSGEGFDWRNNPQVRVRVKDTANVVFVLSYLSLDKQRSSRREEASEEEARNTRPRLHGRVFKNSFHPGKRYLKALVPLPQNSPFVGSNAFSSNSYITTTVQLAAGTDYVYIPFTESAFSDTWRLCVYSDVDDIEVAALSSPIAEWHAQSFSGTWTGKPLSLTVQARGKLTAIVNSKDTFVRVSSVDSSTGQRVSGVDAFWNGEANVEHAVKGSDARCGVVLEGMVKRDGAQQPAVGTPFDLFVFTEGEAVISDVNFQWQPSGVDLVGPSHAAERLAYPSVGLSDDIDIVTSESDEEFEEDDELAASTAAAAAQAVQRAQELEEEVKRHREENERLRRELAIKDEAVTVLERKSTLPRDAASLHQRVAPPSRGSIGSRQGSGSGTGMLGRSSSIGSRQGSRPPPSSHVSPAAVSGISIQPAALANGTRGALGVQRAMDEVGMRLGKLAGADRPPNAAEWAVIKKELREMQQKLAVSRPPTA